MSCMSHTAKTLLTRAPSTPRRFPTTSLPSPNDVKGEQSLTGQALASTIVPLHSDASASTSVTASPMELLEPLDPAVDFKVPLPDWKPPSTGTLEGMNEAVDDGTPIPVVGATEPSLEKFPELREGSQLPWEHEDLEKTTGEQPNARNSEQGLPGSTQDYPPIRLAELRDLVGLERYHRYQLQSLQSALDGITLADGLNRRLLPIVSMASQALADCYQTGDQAGFGNLYKTCDDLQEACKRDDVHPQPIGGLRAPALDQEQPASNSWLQRLPEDCQETFLDFLTSIRIDNNFLADRLSALSYIDFVELCNSPTSENTNSIFGSHHQRKASGYNRALPLQDTAPLQEKIRHFHEGDPFFVLFHSVFDSSCGPRTPEYFRRIHVWSTACARVIAEGKRGSDEFTIATLSAFSQSSPWHLTPRLGAYIGKLLHEGAFLLDPTSKGPTNFKEPLEIRNANVAIAASKFFDEALKGLLAIFLDVTPPDMMPDGVLVLIHAILKTISSTDIRRRAKNFIISKWYISSFLGRILAYPESHGMMMNHHVGANARNTILKEIATRFQKQVFDVLFT
ncbi:MAG: hypothetical protein Q9207_003062, partial [Kuettlingeria erythrocarpa]